MVVAGWPYAEMKANSVDLEGSYLETLDRAPEFGARVRAAERVTRIVGSAVPNFLRTPYGPGWALVGDAGYTRDFITAQGSPTPSGMPSCCTRALDTALTDEPTADDAMRHITARGTMPCCRCMR